MPTYTVSFPANALFVLGTKPSQCETGCQFSSVNSSFTSATEYSLGLVAIAENGRTLTLPRAGAMLTTTLTITNIELGLNWTLVTKPKLWDLRPTVLELDPARSTMNSAQNTGTVNFSAITQPGLGFDYGLDAALLEGQFPLNMPMSPGAIDVEVSLHVQLGGATFTFPINNIEMKSVIQPAAIGAPLDVLEFTAPQLFGDGIALNARLPFGTTCMSGALTLKSSPGGNNMFASLAFDAFVGCDGSIQGVLNPNKAHWNDYPTTAHVVGIWGDTLDLRIVNGVVRNGEPDGFLISTYERGLIGNFSLTTTTPNGLGGIIHTGG